MLWEQGGAMSLVKTKTNLILLETLGMLHEEHIENFKGIGAGDVA